MALENLSFMIHNFIAATRYITINGQDTTDCSNSGLPCKSLIQAVNQAIAGDTINIGAGTFPSVNNIEVIIKKNLVISGAGSGQTIFNLNNQGKSIKIKKKRFSSHIQY